MDKSSAKSICCLLAVAHNFCVLVANLVDEAIELKNGALFKGNGYEFSATEKTINNILDALETIWRDTLIWTERNPISFVVVLIFLLGFYAIHTIGRIEIQDMKQKYEEKRSAARARSVHTNIEGDA